MTLNCKIFQFSLNDKFSKDFYNRAIFRVKILFKTLPFSSFGYSAKNACCRCESLSNRNVSLAERVSVIQNVTLFFNKFARP